MPQVGESLGADPERRRLCQLATPVEEDLETDRGCRLLARPVGASLEAK